MYSINKLQESAKKLQDRYEETVLDTDYKTELFHAHLDTAIESLNRAAELMGPEEPELDNPPADFYSSSITLLIVFVFFAILIWILR